MSDNPKDYDYVLTRAFDAYNQPYVLPATHLRRIVDAVLDAVDDLIIDARADDNDQWPDEGDLIDLEGKPR